MPKELRHWEAYIELKKTVDEFLLSLPLVQVEVGLGVGFGLGLAVRLRLGLTP